MDTEEMVGLSSIAMFAAYLFWKSIESEILAFERHIYLLFYGPEKWLTYFVLLIALLPLAFYLHYKINESIFKRKAEENESKEIAERESERKRKIRETDLSKMDWTELVDHIQLLRKEYLPTEEAEERLKESRKENAEESYKVRVDNLKAELGQLEKIKLREYSSKEIKRKVILKELGEWLSDVYKKEDLTSDQMKALSEEGYMQVNEYCICEKKIITVFVKKISNHSSTHTFLVWGARKLLKKYPEIRNIRGALTKEADITFTYKGKEFALEIETGSLLGKRAQTEKKIKDLDKKYGKRWMFIVSNKKLMPKYRKLGFVTQRADVAEKLEKLLNFDTQFY